MGSHLAQVNVRIVNLLTVPPNPLNNQQRMIDEDDLNEVEEFLTCGLVAGASPWATPASRELFHVFSGYIRHRLDEYRKLRQPLTDEQVEHALGLAPKV
jgi:hypothetical protein